MFILSHKRIHNKFPCSHISSLIKVGREKTQANSIGRDYDKERIGKERKKMKIDVNDIEMK